MDTRVAMVTGASRGIGKAIALRLAQAGSSIIGVSRDSRTLAELGVEIEARGCAFLAVTADLSDSSEIEAAADAAWAWRENLDILVNAAGLLIRKAEADTSPADWDQTIALNVRAPYLLIRDLGQRMYDVGGGAIVNVASIAGVRVTGAPAPYQASKAALIQLTRFFAVKLAPRVRVNAVGPGYVHTELSADWLANPENQTWVESRTPLGRIATPIDIAGPVAFLASDDARYITGQHLLIDGGWSAR